jgi:hypothetical protein
VVCGADDRNGIRREEALKRGTAHRLVNLGFMNAAWIV